MKKLLSAIGGTLTLLAAASSANADSNGAAMNNCKPHDWTRFAEAVEAMDQATLAEMAREPELRICEFAETIVVLLCEMDPLACIEPAAPPPPPPSTEPELPVLRITAPGAHIGGENGGGDESSDTGGGYGGGDNGGSNGGGRDPNDGLR